MNTFAIGVGYFTLFALTAWLVIAAVYAISEFHRVVTFVKKNESQIKSWIETDRVHGINRIGSEIGILQRAISRLDRKSDSITELRLKLEKLESQLNEATSKKKK